MKILYLTPVMKIGGEELSTLSLTKEMVRRGHSVFVMGSMGPMHDEYVAAGARVVLTSRPFRRNIAGILSDARDILAVIQKEGIDVIHSQSIFPTLSAYWGMRKLSHKPRLIFHERGIGKYSYYVIPRVFNYIVDCVITNSDYEANILKKRGMRTPCIRIHNCINTDIQFDPHNTIRCELGIPDDTVVIGIVGRLAPQKGHTCLLEAFKMVVDRLADKSVMMLIVGDGALRGSLEQATSKLGLDQHVVFTGFRRDLASIYPALNMLVVPSLFEPFGNVAVEGGAYGTPVVASSVGGLPEALMHGESGLLVASCNPVKLAQTIIHLIENPELASQLGSRGQELATTYFTPLRVADEVEQVYKTL
jgi:glycosyltransferase involved in cell wall biosynthesis